MNDKYAISLYNIFEGYVRNYRRLNIHQASLSSMFTRREIEYFATVGEYLGFFSFVEDSKRQQGERGTHSRPMDLAWWQYDQREQKGEFFTKLILHLERENLASKAKETIEKLFCASDEDHTPYYVIGIICVSDKSKIEELQQKVHDRNKNQKSEVLMIYRYDDPENEDDFIIEAHFDGFEIKKENDSRIVKMKTDETDYWTMCFDEEYNAKNK